MSRVGKKSIPLPPGVKVVAAAREVRAEGPKGKLCMALAEGIGVEVNGQNEVEVTRVRENDQSRALHGTTRALIANMVTGVSKGFSRNLQLWGVGYQAEVKGSNLSLSIGFCHKVDLLIPTGIEVKTERISVEGVNVWQITVSGADKQVVGQLAALIRKLRPPEPYKGKGIRYEKERILRKAGKSFQSGSGS